MEENPSDSDLLQKLGTDGQRWAGEFYKRFPDGTDEDTLRGWFCNAIEAGRAAHSTQ